jgi:hypothetical protein
MRRRKWREEREEKAKRESQDIEKITLTGKSGNKEKKMFR